MNECNKSHIAIGWNSGVCPLCASHAEIERLRGAITEYMESPPDAVDRMTNLRKALEERDE